MVIHEKARQHAAKQLGLLTRADLKRFGVEDRTAIKKLCDAGELERVFPKVWRVRGFDVTPQQRWLAALKWARGGALSHQTAALHHQLLEEDAVVHVTLTRAGAKAPEGICVHPVKQRLPSSATVQDGLLRFTTVQRTLIDLAAVADEQELQFAVEKAWFDEKIDPVVFLKQLKKRRRKGSNKLRRLLRDSKKRGRPLESPLEVIVWRAIKASPLPRPKVQVEIPDAWGYLNRADFVFRRQRVILEALGWEWHRDRFEEDAERTTRLVGSGYRVLHVTSRMMKDKPEMVLAWIETALTRGRQGRR